MNTDPKDNLDATSDDLPGQPGEAARQNADRLEQARKDTDAANAKAEQADGSDDEDAESAGNSGN